MTCVPTGLCDVTVMFLVSLVSENFSLFVGQQYVKFNIFASSVEVTWWMGGRMDGWMVPRWIMVFVFRLCLHRISMIGAVVCICKISSSSFSATSS